MQAERFYSFNLLAIGVPALSCALPGINKVHAKEMDAWIHARQCTRLKPCTKTKSAAPWKMAGTLFAALKSRVEAFSTVL
ncbi:hypothetical protein [Comamonas thiooxydans]|uniref:hypothetical protein n=1 Tax=Comamonas thiooxydans TaxID=363952 RepID=UPI00209C39A1|nr:hypothetical protein [Comamonas thiooxydans]MCO8248089.1 hypothetical protein [Comamonas thiooxydans]